MGSETTAIPMLRVESPVVFLLDGQAVTPAGAVHTIDLDRVVALGELAIAAALTLLHGAQSPQVEAWQAALRAELERAAATREIDWRRPA